MKKLTILALHLGYGGIEKAIASLANSMSDYYEVNIISTYKLYNEPVFEISDKVKINYLIENLKPNKKELIECIKKFNFASLIKELIKSLKILKLKRKLMIDYIKNCDSDIILSTRDIHNSWLGKYAKKNIIKIGWEHNYHNNNKKYIKKIIKSVSNLDYFVLVSKNLNDFYTNKVKPECVYIPNTIEYFPEYSSDLNSKNIVSIGRLSYEKGFDELIDVFSTIHKNYPDWKLNIIGDGIEYNNILEKIESNNLNDSVILHGYQKKHYINDILSNSSIYVMTSRSESFGIVLLEAFSFGIPCIAFDRANGASEIISNNIDGYLISNSNKEEMINKIEVMINNYDLRKKMGDEGIIKAKQYSADSIKSKWFDLFK